MKKTRYTLAKLFVTAVVGMLAAPAADACTSMIVSRDASGTGRPMLWKHRDCGTEHNFVAEVNPTDGGMRYVGLFNGGDSLLLEAWGGFNEAGFAIINTASYNLSPTTEAFKDQEGHIMSLALSRCRNVEDFARLLDVLPRPLGVSANFGVIDANGNGAYFETNDSTYVRFDVGEKPEDHGVLVRTNFSFSGNETDGMGYIRYDNVNTLLANEIATGTLTPESFTEKASRSYWNSLEERDYRAEGHDRFVYDQDFISRRISSASIVIEGVLPGETTDKTVMWTMLGYPACSYVMPVTINNVPEELQPLEEGWRSPLCSNIVTIKDRVFPIKRGSGKNYIDMNYVDFILPEVHAISLENYARGRILRNNIVGKVSKNATKGKAKKQDKKKK